MGDGYHYRSIKRLNTSRDVMNFVKYVGAVVPHSTRIANAHSNPFENDESLLVLECFLIDLLWTHRPVTVFTHLTVKGFLSGLW